MDTNVLHFSGKNKWYLLACMLLHTRTQLAISAVTYDFSGGRFGDNLVAYCHAKWVAHKHQLPLLYRPFQYSDQLVLHTREQYVYTPEIHKNFMRTHMFESSEKKVKNQFLAQETLFVIPYFPETLQEVCDDNYHYIKVDWHDPVFIQELRACISPRIPIKPPQIPEGHMSIAVHVRTGAGFDDLNGILGFPLKFPDNSFYIEQIKYIAKEFPDKKMYVLLFTDHTQPAALAQQYHAALNNPRITYAYRTETNNWLSNVLEDFFAMLACDCLIRPESSFSIMAEKLGEYKIVISPAQVRQKDQRNIVCAVTIKKGPL